MRALLIKAFRGQFLVEVLIRSRGLLILPIATRALGPEEYGWVAFAGAVTGIVGAAATLGMPLALTRFLPGKRSPEEQAQVLWPGVVSTAVTVTGFAAIGLVIALAFPVVPEGIPFALMVLALANVITNELKILVFNYYRTVLDLTPYYRFLVADVVTLAALQLLVLVVLDGGALMLVGSIVAGDALLLAAALSVVARRVPWQGPSRRILVPLYRFGLPLTVNPMLNWVNNAVDRFFIQAFVGSATLGVYAAGYNIAYAVVGIVATPIFAVAPAVMFRAWDEGERERALELGSRISQILLLGCLPGMLCLTFFGEPIVTLLAGDAFAAAHDYIFWISLGYLMMWLGDTYGYPLWLHERQYLYSFSLIGSAGLNVALNAVLVPSAGAIGAAYATAISFGFLAALMVAFNVWFRYARPPLVGLAGLGSVAAGCWLLASLAWPSSATLLDSLAFSLVTTAAFLVLVYMLGLVPRDMLRAALRRETEPASAETTQK